MERVELGVFFTEIFEIVKKYVPESDHEALLDEIVSSMIDESYDLSELYGIDELLDEVLNDYYKNDEFFEED